MITVDQLRKCAYLSATQIESLIRKNYPKDTVIQSDFVGISNGNQFCYKISYPDEQSKNGLSYCKVFVYIDSDGNIIADY
jgi:hypothetical protein